VRPDKKRVEGAAKRDFLAGLRAGLKRDDAARQAGFTANAFYYARRADPVFALAWAWAVDLSAADAYAARTAAALPATAPGEARIAPNSNRVLQLRPVRRASFDDRRKRIFLDHFAGTADAHQAAEAAGVAYSTVLAHRRNDPDFAAGWDEALAVAYAALEAEAVRQRLEAQRDLREGLCPKGEIPREFDRVVRLLARYERKDGRIGMRGRGRGGEQRWSFDEAIALLDRKLRALGVRRGVVPPDAALLPPPATGDGPEEEK
jgi:hypothetical protein